MFELLNAFALALAIAAADAPADQGGAGTLSPYPGRCVAGAAADGGGSITPLECDEHPIDLPPSSSSY